MWDWPGAMAPPWWLLQEHRSVDQISVILEPANHPLGGCRGHFPLSSNGAMILNQKLLQSNPILPWQNQSNAAVQQTFIFGDLPLKKIYLAGGAG